mgnify:CR=1 FL=1
MRSPGLAPLNLPAQQETLETAQAAFLQAYPAFETTRRLDQLRATEYARLDRRQHVYLDYTGGALHAESQLREHLLLARGAFGNPHSKSLTSLATTEPVERARDDVLRYFNAAPDEYLVIFTPNASGALCDAPTPEAVRRAVQRSGLPIDRLTEVTALRL